MRQNNKTGGGQPPFLLKGRLHMRRLTVQKGKKTVYSKPWDFEAMCLVDDCRSTANPVQMCTACVEYLFDGVLTTEQLHGFGGRKMYELCLTVVCWYRADVLKASASCNVSADGRMTAGKLRDVYRAIFQAWGRLPDEVGSADAISAVFGNRGRQRTNGNPVKRQRAVWNIKKPCVFCIIMVILKYKICRER